MPSSPHSADEDPWAETDLSPFGDPGSRRRPLRFGGELAGRAAPMPIGDPAARGAYPAGRSSEAGYNLVVLAVLITVMNIAIAAALPYWSSWAQATEGRGADLPRAPVRRGDPHLPRAPGTPADGARGTRRSRAPYDSPTVAQPDGRGRPLGPAHAGRGEQRRPARGPEGRRRAGDQRRGRRGRRRRLDDGRASAERGRG